MIHNFSIETFVLSEKITFSDFFELIKDKNIFSGYAYHENNMHRHHLFIIDKKMYASQELKQLSDKHDFQHFFEVSPDYLEDNSFKYAEKSTHFNFEADVLVEIQYYSYQKEQKIIFQQQNKVDLIFSIHLHADSENNFNQLETKKYPSLDKAVKWHQMMQELNSRCNNILAKK